ncbi:MAG: GNAT family N-acetyltransferase [Burkholderiales bacterium]|nr:GNAT family N-acetyltransferase [Burkholderiales bacterium]
MPIIRPSQDADITAITAIYAHHVRHGTGTFEVDPPSAADMASRREDVRGKGLPYLVAVEGDKVLGFAYCNWFKVIGDSDNAGSIGVHRSVGFGHVGILKSCGWKFDRWLDVVLMDRALGWGDACPPGP